MAWSCLGHAMGSHDNHGRRNPNKLPLHYHPDDTALHRCILLLALEYMLIRWRVLPHSARLDLYSLYLETWQTYSEFAIWFDIYPLLTLEDRYEFYRATSLAFPDFAAAMQATWYQCTVRGGLDEMDATCPIRQVRLQQLVWCLRIHQLLVVFGAWLICMGSMSEGFFVLSCPVTFLDREMRHRSAWSSDWLSDLAELTSKGKSRDDSASGYGWDDKHVMSHARRTPMNSCNKHDSASWRFSSASHHFLTLDPCLFVIGGFPAPPSPQVHIDTPGPV